MGQALCIATATGFISARYCAVIGNTLNLHPAHSAIVFGFIGASLGLAFGLKLRGWGH